MAQHSVKTSGQQHVPQAGGFIYPRANTKRFYLVRAMEKGGTPTKIAARAAVLARKDGQQFDVDDFMKMDFGFMLRWLEEKGATVEQADGNRVKVLIPA